MKRKPQRVEARVLGKALAERPGKGDILQMVLTRFYRKGGIPGLPDGPQLPRIAAAEYHPE